MVQAVMFDLDGTLHHREASIQSFVQKQAERCFPQVVKEAYVERFIDLDQGGYVWKDKVYQQLVEEFTLSNITWQELLQDYLTHFPAHAKLFPQALDLLRSLKKQEMKLAIISNGYSKFQRDVIRALQIEPFFDEMIISEEEGVKKPNPHIFERALSRLSVTADKAIYVGDHVKNDIEGARRVGIHPIWKRQSHHKSTTVAGDHVSGLLEVLAVIKRIRERNEGPNLVGR